MTLFGFSVQGLVVIIHQGRGNGHWNGVRECCRDAVELGHVKLVWRRLAVTTANALVDLLYSGHCSKHLSYIGVFVIQNLELNKSGLQEALNDLTLITTPSDRYYYHHYYLII